MEINMKNRKFIRFTYEELEILSESLKLYGETFLLKQISEEIIEREKEISYCLKCEKPFFPKSSIQKYCPCCSENYKSDYNNEYNNSAKGLIYKVIRYMSSTKVYSKEEMSFFKNNALNAYETMSKEEFSDWISKKHFDLKIESKNRKQK